MRIKTKVFLDILLNHSKDPDKVKKIMSKDKRLSRDEKSIVNCFLLMRRNKNSDGLGVAELISKQNDPFVESMRCFVIAGFLNNLNIHKKSLLYFEDCYQILPKNILPHFEFVVLLNLFNLHINLRDFKSAFAALCEMGKINNLNKEDSLTFYKSHFTYYTVTEDFPSAQKYFAILNENISQFEKHTLSLIYLDIWDYAITFRQFDLCFEVLEKMKVQKTYVLSQNYNYMKILLMHYLKGDPVYIVENEFADYPDLLIQLKFMRALESNRMTEASCLWETLCQMKPHVFGKDFKYFGQKTIFFRCLEKYSSKLQGSGGDLVRDPHLTISESIEYALLANDEISKEELFSFLYGREAENKDDFNRLARDIYKFKMSRKIEIIGKKGTYSIVKKVS